MSVNAEQTDRLRDYLLGVIPWEEASDIEQKLLGDADFYEEVLVTEDELVDLYVADRLPAAEKQRFEAYFLTTTERKQKARFAKVFAAYLARQQAEVLSAAAGASAATEKPRRAFWPGLGFFRHRPVLSFVAILSGCVALVALLWLGFRPNRSQLGTETLPVALIPGQVRDGGTTPKVVLSPKVVSLEFELETAPAPYQNYYAEVLYETERVWEKDHLTPVNKAGRQSVLMAVPADRLKPGYYQIKLSAVSASGELELVNRYAFRVGSE
ncbi:MAG TPA: hypothetical protein VKB46_24090 [Pyrinomonadaceae bacterium]|nr:hypothetical protein [Pyrinomonadaceae bacterium]